MTRAIAAKSYRQHDNSSGICFPAHPPEVVPGRMERALRHDELPRRVEPGDEVGVDVVATLVVVAGLELDPGVVVG